MVWSCAAEHFENDHRRNEEIKRDCKLDEMFTLVWHIIIIIIIFLFFIIFFKLDDCIAHATKSRSRNYQSPINPGKHQHYACGINDYTRILSGLLTQTGALMC